MLSAMTTTKRGGATPARRRQLEEEVAQIARASDDPPHTTLARQASICGSVLFHGSSKPLPTGTVLQAWTNQGWFPEPIEAAMERGRPSGAPSRLSSFFLVDDRKQLRDAGAPMDYVYRVTPVGVCSKHHHGWMGNVYNVMIPFIRHQAPQEEKDAATPQLVHLDEWIWNYWAGAPYHHRPGQAKSTWEFLAPAIIVEEQL